MAKYDELRKDPVISQWIDTIRKKPRTVKGYLMGMQKYIDFTGCTPDDLLNEAEEEAAKQVIMRKRKLLARLLAFRKYLEEETYFAPTSKRNYMNAVNSFYRASYIEVPKLIGSIHAEPTERNTRPLAKDDIRDVLKVADVLEKAIVLVGVSSGLAEADIMNLKVSDFKNNYDPEIGITTLKLVRIKTGIRFVTFLTPEATNAVLDYLSFRNRVPKKGMNPVRRDQLEKQRVTRDEGYLFVLRNVSDKYLEMPYETDTQWWAREEMRKYDDNAFTKLYSRLSEKAQKCNPDGWNTVRSHNMRKYFNSALINAGFDFFFVDHMLGHKADAVDRAYYWHDAEQLKDLYKKCVPYLTIQKPLDVVESPEYQQIKQENQILQAETARHVVERSELQELRAEMEKIKETRDSMEFIKSEYMQFADLNKILQIKKELQLELEEVSKLKEMLIKEIT